MADAKLFRTILCPVDFSEHSRQALSYAALLVARGGGRLVVIYVEDPLLAAAAKIEYDEKVMVDKARMELRRFVEQAIDRYGVSLSSVTMDVAVGRPWEMIDWTADKLKCDLIVIGSQGRTGANKLMFGSTTHRILRRSALPVLATPPVTPSSSRPPRGWPGKRALAPVDLGARARPDALAAAVVARELGTTIDLVHIVEPVNLPPWLEVDASRKNLQLQRLAMARLTSLKNETAWAAAACRVEMGEPAEKIAAVAGSTDVGLVIMTRRRGQGLLGPRQGSISYAVLLKANTPVMALPNDPKWLRRALALRPKSR